MVDSHQPGSTGLSPAAALKRIDDLTTHAVSRPLNVAMGEVYEKVTECDKPARVVYVLTDLARSAWNTGRPAEGLDKVEKIKKAKTRTDGHVRSPSDAAGGSQPLGRDRRAVAERRHPRRAG